MPFEFNFWCIECLLPVFNKVTLISYIFASAQYVFMLNFLLLQDSSRNGGSLLPSIIELGIF